MPFIAAHVPNATIQFTYFLKKYLLNQEKSATQLGVGNQKVQACVKNIIEFSLGCLFSSLEYLNQMHE